MTASPDRRAMVAKIHIARKELALAEDTYRAILSRVTGHASSTACSDKQLGAVLAEFERLGWTLKGTGTRRTSGESWVRMIYAIWGELAPLLDAATDDTLRAFVRRQTKSRKNPEGISDPKWLDAQEGRKVIEGLKGWLARVKAKQGENEHAE